MKTTMTIARVDHRAAHLALQLHGLLDVDREAVEDRVEDAAHLARLDEVRVERVEDLRVPAQRVAERGALLDAGLHVAQDVGEDACCRSGPARMSRHCTMGRPASIIVAKRRVKVTMSFVADARAELEAEAPCAFFLTLVGWSCCARSRWLTASSVSASIDALAQLAGARARFPDEFGHVRCLPDSKVYKPAATRVKV